MGKKGEKKLFFISVNNSNRFELEDNKSFIAERCSLNLNEQVIEEYYVFLKIYDDLDAQNFTMALPMSNCIDLGRRYYETFYIPGEGESDKLNFLINSKFSSIDRTKLTDDDSKREEIKEEIENEIVSVWKNINSMEFQNAIRENSEWRREISAIFHKCLGNKLFIDCCSENKITNRYLAKYEHSDVSEDKYIVYKRKDKEPYEKNIIGQSWSKEKAKSFFENYILKGDTIKFSEENYIDEVKKAYQLAFSNEDKNLKYILNAIGSLENLVRLRICGDSFAEGTSEKEIDDWLIEIDYSPVEIPLSIIARYKIHSGVSYTGKINQASFKEYLFNKNSSGVFANVQKNQFDEKYIKLKDCENTLTLINSALP